MKIISKFEIDTKLLIKHLSYVYYHIIGVLLWLQLVIVVGAMGIAYIDKKPIGETLYLAFITALTIGYGDLTPESWLSRVIAVLIGYTGIVITGITVAASIKALEMTVVDQKNQTDSKRSQKE